MKSVILIVLIVISFSLGISAYLWEQLAVAILFSIIFPVISLYFLISGRYKDTENTVKPKKKKKPVDNYFHPVEKG
jgi:hypothetical protein